MSINTDILDESSDFLTVVKYCLNFVREAEKLQGERIFPIIASVVKNIDPEKRRRIKVADPLFGGKLESDWIKPLKVTQNNDPPLPQINQNVLILFVDGDSNDGYYLPIINDVNPSLQKKDEVLDHYEVIEGDRRVVIEKDDNLIVKNDNLVEIKGNQEINISGDRKIEISASDNLNAQDIVIEADATVLIKNDSGAFISLNSSGIVLIQDAFGRSITLGGGGIAQWNLNGFPLSIINASGMSINGKQVATIGAVDNRGDVIVSRGW